MNDVYFKGPYLFFFFFISDLGPTICLVLIQTTRPSLQQRENHPAALSQEPFQAVSLLNTRFKFPKGRYKVQL